MSKDVPRADRPAAAETTKQFIGLLASTLLYKPRAKDTPRANGLFAAVMGRTKPIQARVTMMNEQLLFCIQCDEPFAFSHEDQERYDRRGFDPPRRCPACRQHRVRMDDGDEGREGRRRTRPRRRRHWGDEMVYH